MPHKPVLVREALAALNLKPGQAAADGTLGSGGHAQAILKAVGAGGRLIGLDQDPEALGRAQKIFEKFPNVSLHYENFENLDRVLDGLNLAAVDAVILDVGLSSEQLEDAARGFSFEREGPLDMRMDPGRPVAARDLIHELPERGLADLFWRYGNERRSRRIARRIVEARRRRKIETTRDLVEIIGKALPSGSPARKGNRPPWARRHPATKVFQALRIAVNDELGHLERGLPRIWSRLAPLGRLAVISFHSLEDRIVKETFRNWARQGEANLIFRKPVVPSLEERRQNPRSRSAKLRAVEKRG